MTHWKDNLPLLEKLFDHQRVGLITDMDGTVSPIVPVPSDAAPTERNRELLRELHGKLALVAVVSGRAAADVRERVDLPELTYAGNHGLERWEDGGVQLAPQAKPYRPNLEKAIQAIEAIAPDGMWVEDKQATISVHYRDTANPAETVTEFEPKFSKIVEDHDLRLFQGRMIFELRPPLDVDKGTIFEQLINEHNLDAAIYIGDDTTDADALKKAQQLRKDGSFYALAIGVASDETPPIVIAHSDVMVSGVSDVESLLAWISEKSSSAS
ncbi:MAG: trehalose-phosphatase [Chloroflexota bacterium]